MSVEADRLPLRASRWLYIGAPNMLLGAAPLLCRDVCFDISYQTSPGQQCPSS